MTLHISWSRKDREVVRTLFCQTEEADRPMYGWFQDWYGWEVTCLGCGDRWQDGERGERPFMRGWRKDSIAKAMRAVDRLAFRGCGGEAYS